MFNSKSKFYNGIDGLLKDGVELPRTKDQIKEILKCMDDISYFLKTYVKVINQERGKVPFRLYDYQERYINLIHNHNRVISLQARQSGKTASTCGYILHYMMFNEDKNISLLANKHKTAKKILADVKNMYKSLPIWLQIGIVEWNKTDILLGNGTKVSAAATTADSIRGDAVKILYIDECAFIDHNTWDEFWTSTYPVISSSKTAKIIMSSCVPKDTLIFSDDGIKEIGEYVDHNQTGTYYTDNYKILGYKDEYSEGNVIHNNGLKETKILHTSFGGMEGTLNHKMWACKDGEYGWYEHSELNQGDFICLKYGMDKWAGDDRIFDMDRYINKKSTKNPNILVLPDEIDHNLAYLLGQTLSDGYVDNNKNNRLVISSEDDIGVIFDNLGLRYTKYDDIHYNCGSVSLVHFLNNIIDIHKKSNEKYISDRIMRFSRENICSFLSGFFDGDGYPRKDKGTIALALSSKKMLSQIKMLLLNLGIVSTYYIGITPKTKKVNVESVYYKLELDKYNSKLFYDIVGFGLKRKQDKQTSLNLKPTTRNSYDTIPFSKDIIKDFKIEYPYKHPIRSILSFSGISKASNLSRMQLLKWKKELIEYDYFGNKKIRDFFNDNVSEDLKWLKVKNTTFSEKETFDFSLDDVDGDKWCHSVLYNGFVGHQTPKGLNHFYKFVQDAKNGKNDYQFMEVKWDEVPGRDEEWKQMTLASGVSANDFKVEFENEFMGSAGTLIESEHLKQMVIFDPVDIRYDDNFNIYEYPNPEKNYVLFSDFSEGGDGDGNDYTTCQVIDVTALPWEQVAVYRDDQLLYREAASILYKIGKFYNECLIIGEANTIGLGILDTLNYDYEYNNLFFGDELENKKSVDYFGIKTTKKSKRIGNRYLKEYIEGKSLIINDHTTIYELSNYIKVKDSYKADEGKHDDLVMPLVQFAYFMHRKDWVERWLDDVGTYDKRKEKLSRIEESLLPMGFMFDGIDLVSLEDEDDFEGDYFF